MVETVSIHNFKSYEEATLSLSPLTLLIGANASGKTNCIEALRFLSRLAHGQRIDDILEDVRQNDLAIRGKSTDIIHNGLPNKIGGKFSEFQQNSLIEFVVLLPIVVQWRTLVIAIEIQSKDDVKGARVFGEQISENFNEHPKLYETSFGSSLKDRYYRHELGVHYNNFSGKKYKSKNESFLACSNSQAIFTQLDVPSRFDTEKARNIIPAAVTKFQEALRNIIFLDLNPQAMVGYSFIVDNKLKPDGRNLSSVLYDICVTQGRKAEVLAFIGELPEQRISDVGFLLGPRQEAMVTVTETFGHAPVTREAPLLSDGTLRVLAVAAALLSAPTGGLVVIEEIDNGVHPSRARALLANILAASKRNSLRVLLTSHNPALLDTLPKESVPDVVCCYRDPEQGDSRLIRLADLTDYPDLVARGPLGQLMTQGLLDRYLKNQRTPEQKAEQAQEWLRQLQLEDEEEAA